MNPKDRAIAALERRTPSDIVPTMEIEFQLHKELTGQSLILGDQFGKLSNKERLQAIDKNISTYIMAAEMLDYSSITVDPLFWEFGHGIGTKYYYPTLEDQIDVVKGLNEKAGDKYLLAVSMDSTYGIPLAQDIEKFIYMMFDEEEILLDRAERSLEQTLESARKLIDAGVSLIYSCSDYCFGQGPFYSSEMFEKYVYPYLKRQTAAFREMGAYVIKHTDGNIMPIVDYIIDTKPHAIHSIDPMAGMDIVDFKNRFGDKVCIMGNVDVSKLEQGPRSEIVKSAEYALLGCKRGGGYIYSTCNTIFDKVPLENYRLMLEVRDQYGRYDSDEEVK